MSSKNSWIHFQHLKKLQEVRTIISIAQEILYSKITGIKNTSDQTQPTDPQVGSLPKPEMRSTPEKNIQKENSNALYVLLGILVAGGIAAVIAGGSSSDNSETGGTPTTGNGSGNVEISW